MAVMGPLPTAPEKTAGAVVAPPALDAGSRVGVPSVIYHSRGQESSRFHHVQQSRLSGRTRGDNG